MNPIVRMQGVQKAFGKQVIYRDLSFDVRPGETLCVIGPSGVGKSVMLKLMIGLLEADGGELEVCGQNIATLKSDDAFLKIRQRVAMVFQGAALFDSMTVFDNIAYPLREHGLLPESELHAHVAQKLEWVGLPGIEHKRPAELSGGMKKRVGLARSIASDPEVVLYDEPTTGLDPVNSRRIGDLIQGLKSRLSCTSIVVTHDMALVRQVSDRVAMVYGGGIVAIGPYDELMNSGPKIVKDFVTGAAGAMKIA